MKDKKRGQKHLEDPLLCCFPSQQIDGTLWKDIQPLSLYPFDMRALFCQETILFAAFFGRRYGKVSKEHNSRNILIKMSSSFLSTSYSYTRVMIVVEFDSVTGEIQLILHLNDPTYNIF